MTVCRYMFLFFFVRLNAWSWKNRASCNNCFFFLHKAFNACLSQYLRYVSIKHAFFGGIFHFNEIACYAKYFSQLFNTLTVYHTKPTSSDSETQTYTKNRMKTLYEKGKMLVTSIFSF